MGAMTSNEMCNTGRIPISLRKKKISAVSHFTIVLLLS